jgi:hypothetical protein
MTRWPTQAMTTGVFAALLTLVLMLVAVDVPAQSAASLPSGHSVATVVGSGRLKIERRAISGFQAISLSGPMKLLLRQGGREAVEVRADDNLMPLIETRVVSDGGMRTLQIGGRENASFTTRNEPTVTVDFVALSALSLTGSGDAQGDGLKTDALAISLSGSGNLRLSRLDSERLSARLSGSGSAELAGRAAHADIVLDGSGELKAAALEVDTMGLQAAGSGDARVHARKQLAVELSGSGDVAYGGDARLRQSVTGSGRIRQR